MGAIQQMREALDALERELNEKEEVAYRSRKHKNIKKGDWVRKGDEVGIVGWTDENGYFGLDIKTGNMGFRAPCRIDEYDLLPEELLLYYTKSRTYRVSLTGEDVADILYRIGSPNCNPSKSKEKLRAALVKC